MFMCIRYCYKVGKEGKIMYNTYNKYPRANYMNRPCYGSNPMYDLRRMNHYQYFYPMYTEYYMKRYPNNIYPSEKYVSGTDYRMQEANDYTIGLIDYGPEPFAVNIRDAVLQNNDYRTSLWTGDHLQITLMSIEPGEDIGLEMHPDVDQFIRVEQGEGIIRMGSTGELDEFIAEVYDDYIFVIPAGKWHNLINTGSAPLKIYSIYAPPNHPHGTVHKTKSEAEEAEEYNH